MSPSFITRSVKVETRHAKKCKYLSKGTQHKNCRCLKVLRIYVGDDLGRTSRKSAKTRSWEEAEKRAQEIRDSWNPEKQELKQLRAAKEREQVRIEDAISTYILDMVSRLGNTGSVSLVRSMLGHIDPLTKGVTRNGHLLNYLDSLPPTERPTYISEVTPALLTTWRSSWNFGDLTASNRWKMVRAFCNFCEIQGWIPSSPARNLKPLRAKSGNRTAIFTDQQYSEIIDAASEFEPENVPIETRKGWKHRLTAFVELIRWSGMDLIDAVQFRAESVDGEGVLRYNRQKTNVLATVQLPDHVVELLGSVPLERDSVGAEQPFRQKNAKPQSDTATWARRIESLFKIAGIIDVLTPIGRTRKPHAKMFRDTCAVWFLRQGASLHSVSKILGHSNPAITSKCYLPWVPELEKAHIAENRKALAAGLPKPLDGSNVIAMRTKR